MRFLSILSACLILSLTACNHKAYPDMQRVTVRQFSKRKNLQPDINKAMYRCIVDGKTFLKKFHLSGILFIKEMDDKTLNVVFQNELGVNYFSFSWTKSEQFKVISIMPQMNKPALIKTLKKDFELMLMVGIPKYSNAQYKMPDNKDTLYVRYPLDKGFVNYIVDSSRWYRIENADDKRKVVVFNFEPTPLKQLPNDITIHHLRANFSIQLKKINDADTTE